MPRSIGGVAGRYCLSAESGTPITVVGARNPGLPGAVADATVLEVRWRLSTATRATRPGTLLACFGIQVARPVFDAEALIACRRQSVDLGQWVGRKAINATVCREVYRVTGARAMNVFMASSRTASHDVKSGSARFHGGSCQQRSDRAAARHSTVRKNGSLFSGTSPKHASAKARRSPKLQRVQRTQRFSSCCPARRPGESPATVMDPVKPFQAEQAPVRPSMSSLPPVDFVFHDPPATPR